MLSPLISHLAASVLLSASPSPLADVFVDVSNASCATGTGSAGSPVCSISAAIALAAPGDTIRIAPGTYVENVMIAFDLDLIGTGGAGVTVVDGGQTGSVITIPAAVTVAIDGLTLTNGLALQGGGVDVSGNLTLSNSTISGNRSTTSGGGGIGSYYGFGTVTITNSTISNNTADFFGGAINVYGGNLIITGSTLSNNTAAEYGGAVAMTDGTLDMTDSTISGNQVTYGFGGGLELGGSSSVTLTGTTISGNSSPNGGGAFDVFGGSFSLTNCTLSGNSAEYGGAISMVLTYGANSLTNVTITGNTALDYGGGVYSYGTLIAVRNSLIAQNSAGAGYLDYADAYGSFNSLGHNLVGIGGLSFFNGVNGNQVGSIAMPLDPLLGPLADNGGPTETHAPTALSPALDAGDPLIFPATDQRGALRPQGPASDIGAVEGTGGPDDGSLCNGDGGDQMGCTNCPCANNAAVGTVGGCLNSGGTSTRLAASGSTSISLPTGDTTDLRFGLSGAPPSAFCILNSGDGLAPGNMANPCFGTGNGAQAAVFDGLRCAVTNTRRHGGRSADGNGDVGVTNNPWGGEGGPPPGIAVAGGGFAAGQTRYFQVIHRDDPLAVCLRGLNTSQAVRVLFTP